jgi:hypothetical protein
VRRQEGRLRYATLIWLAWYVYRAGSSDDTVACLRRARVYARGRLPAELALDWASQFAIHDVREGVSDGDVDKLLPLLQAAAEVSEEQWDAIAERLRPGWYFWHWYGEGERQPAPAPRPLKNGLPSNWLSMAQSGLLFFPSDRIHPAAQRFCSDAMTLGLVPREYRQEVISLYLTAMGRAVLARRWATAGRALLAALRTGAYRPQALAAWRRFFHVAWTNFMGL